MDDLSRGTMTEEQRLGLAESEAADAAVDPL
jgi:hypothetical protein